MLYTYNCEQSFTEWSKYIRYWYCIHTTIMWCNPQEYMMISPLQQSTWAGLDSALSASCQKLLLLRGREVETSRADAACTERWKSMRRGTIEAESNVNHMEMLSRCQILSYSDQYWPAAVEICSWMIQCFHLYFNSLLRSCSFCTLSSHNNYPKSKHFTAQFPKTTGFSIC